MSGGIDWGGLLRAACARGVRPAEMWGMTPVELLLVLGRAGGPAAMGRTRLEELAAEWPDRRGEDGDG